MPPKKDPKKDLKGKQPQKKAPTSAKSGGKAKKKKWSRVKQRDHLNNMPYFDKVTYGKMKKDVPYKCVTPSDLSSRYKIRVSLARAALKELEAEGRIRAITKHNGQLTYTRTTAEKQSSVKQ